ncbi:transposase [Parageobacillus thermoglucosidasius]|nr:transposase [Parageobacillus thermoglucosidasius]
MSKSIPNVDWANQLESAIRQFVKEKLELIMREEIKHFLEIAQAETSNMRNGYYQGCIPPYVWCFWSTIYSTKGEATWLFFYFPFLHNYMDLTPKRKLRCLLFMRKVGDLLANPL